MAKVGFLGLGIMGAPMAGHLVDAGHSVTVWSHNTEKAERFALKRGCSLAKTPAEVARKSEVSFLCVGDTEMSREVILGDQGLVHGATEGDRIVDCSTISPLVSKEIGAQLAAKKIRFLDAPCTGSKSGAETGTLSFMIGGDRDTFEQTRPLFETMGKSLYYCGAQGMGLHAKVTQNLILGNILQAFNEGLVLSTKGGVDPEVMIEILNNTGARSGYVAAKAPSVLKGDFATTFSVRWMEKDLGLAIEVASSLGVPLFTTSASRQMLQAAIAMGYGEEDISGSIRVLEEMTDCPVRSVKEKAVSA